jgi:hypothetical protein
VCMCVPEILWSVTFVLLNVVWVFVGGNVLASLNPSRFPMFVFRDPPPGFNIPAKRLPTLLRTCSPHTLFKLACAVVAVTRFPHTHTR